MGITFDHVEGVVQKQSDGASSGGNAGAPAKPKAAESPEAEQRRRERLASRLHAD